MCPLASRICPLLRISAQGLLDHVFGACFLPAMCEELFINPRYIALPVACKYFLPVYGLSFNFSNKAFYRKQKAFNFDEVKCIDFFFFLDFILGVRPKTFTSILLSFYYTFNSVIHVVGLLLL